ncbi:NADPH-dependent FMN reductase [Microlunatus sp. GCM10028923]|uniref:NADPH-dependent FMN reductase n=1 Tax=Microlunatus sp. GCM10028923 TaxID=3273400 RepID=UPI00361E8E6F
MSITITVVSGNPRPGSRTLRVASAAADLLGRELKGDVAEPIELSDLAGELFAADHPQVDAAVQRVVSSTIAVIATPSYKGAYTGLLKAFLDHFRAGSLTEVIAVPVIVAGAPAHTLSTDLQLQPVLRELGAALPTNALALTEAQLDDLGGAVDRWAAAGALDRLTRLTGAVA